MKGHDHISAVCLLVAFWSRCILCDSQSIRHKKIRQDKKRLVNLYYHEVAPIAELKIWASCAGQWRKMTNCQRPAIWLHRWQCFGQSRDRIEVKPSMANQDRLYIIVLLRWGSRTRILALFRRRTIPGFSSDAAQAIAGLMVGCMLELNRAWDIRQTLQKITLKVIWRWV